MHDSFEPTLMSLRASSSPSTFLRCGAKSSCEPDEKKVTAAGPPRRLKIVFAVRTNVAFLANEDNIVTDFPKYNGTVVVMVVPSGRKKGQYECRRILPVLVPGTVPMVDLDRWCLPRQQPSYCEPRIRSPTSEG